MARVFNTGPIAELVTKDAEELAKEVAQGNTERRRDNQEKEATRSQMRRFYQEFLKLRQRIKSGGEDAYKKNEVALKMLISKARYATGRKGVKIPNNFTNWFEDNIKAINGAQDVEAFGHYFEAFMGYFYYYSS